MKVRAKTDVYIDASWRDAGTVFDYYGPADINLEPLPGQAAEPLPQLAPATPIPYNDMIGRLRAAAAAGLPPTVPAVPPPPAATPETGFTTLRPPTPEAPPAPPLEGILSVRLPPSPAADGSDLLS